MNAQTLTLNHQAINVEQWNDTDPNSEDASLWKQYERTVQQLREAEKAAERVSQQKFEAPGKSIYCCVDVRVRVCEVAFAGC